MFLFINKFTSKIACLLIYLTILPVAVASAQSFYSVQTGGNGLPGRVYNAENNTTTYRYTVLGDGRGTRSNRLKMVMVTLPTCPGNPIEVVSFDPDLPDGDQPPFSPTNPAIFIDEPDNIFKVKGIRWHGWHGADVPGTPAVLMEPNASRVFSFTVKGNNLAGNSSLGLWYWEGVHFVDPFLPISGPSCHEGPTPTPTPTPTPHPTATPTPTPHPTATPTPTPPPARCQSYTMTRAVKGAVPGNVWSLYEREMTTQDGKSLQCIQKMRQERADFCASNATVQRYNLFNKPLFAVSRPDPSVQDRYTYVDNLTALAGGQLCYAVSPLFTNLGKDACQKEPGSFLCQQHKAYQNVLGAGNRRNHPRWQTFYFDENCEVIFNPTAAQRTYTCDAALVETRFTGNSPISLIWEKGFSVESDITTASFPLELGIDGATYEWKASAKAPLLVFDPEHNGLITSADQLFGDWALGGQRIASLASSLPTSWNNGYEALGTMDSNGDGKISGNELEPFGLWFDINRDGISQPGEVKELKAAGVTGLYYKNPLFNEDSHAHELEIGFERTVNGKTEVLPSVDWKAKRVK